MKRWLKETEADRIAMFRRRALFLGGLQLTAFGALGARLYALSIVDGERYHVLAEDNRLSLRFLAPVRGRILDRNGTELARNEKDYSIVVIPEQVDDLRDTLVQLRRVLQLSDAEIEVIMTRARRQRSFLPITVKKGLDWEAFARFNAAAPYFAGVQPSSGVTRRYPFRSDLAHVLGYVAAVAKEDLGASPILSLPGFKVGKEGIERSFEKTLQGTGGTRRVEVNARGRVVREVARDEPVAGGDVTLTIDHRLQHFTAERMGEESAGIVVMDVDTGAVRALVSTPAYDPNDFVNGISRSNWSGLLKDPRKPLINKALSGLYPPGSTFKMLVALAALEAGVITPETTYYCNGRHKLGNQLFHCWKRWGHGKVDLTQAIAQSCDVYFYELASELGHKRIGEVARRFGLGQTFSVPIGGEKAGLVPDDAWKRARRNIPWVGGDTVNMSIGQGALLATPLQLATMTARLVNGGYPVVPSIVSDAVEAPLGPPIASKVHLDILRATMSEVVNGRRGTARASKIPAELGQMGGKTGTAQVRRISAEERESGVIENELLAWKQRDHALFVGFAPVDKPRYAVSVLVQHGGGGSTVAAPVARDVLAKALELDLLEIAQTQSPQSDPPTEAA